MIGNDIVDLKAAAGETNWRRKGFLEKVFSARERELLSPDRDQHKIVWLLWSMKEAAYKARQRRFNMARSLDWQSLECSLGQITSEGASGEVKAGGKRYFTVSEISSEKIHTCAIVSEKQPLKNWIFETSSEKAKQQLLITIAEHFSVPVKELAFLKNQLGVPYISLRDKPLFDQFSFSDHGRFAAFSLSLRMS